MLGLLRKLLPYLHPYRGLVALSLAQVFIMTGFELVKPWPLKIVIEERDGKLTAVQDTRQAG